MRVGQSVLSSIAENGGFGANGANDGRVITHADAKRALLASVANNTGSLRPTQSHINKALSFC